MKYFAIILVLCCICCKQNPIPKPNAYLSLNYPKPTYQKTEPGLPFQFKTSKNAVYTIENKSWSNIHYPQLKADINITYQTVNNNLKQLVLDAEKLTYKHTLIADHIEVYPFENKQKRVYARLFQITGNVASPIQFQATDSVKHFISGSLYFNIRPNYDSILPSINFVKKDIQQIIETLEWTN
ncbi:gliding motility-associated lipoprotein GldD [Wenyingzhuangia heitensis]|uniref:Gliding motility-associated lipoprotein GldD n=1 Tax=Wenyingzhuangia heitensis TaxID=1487859 RepID=A0ABX0U5D2_9FLAO|nr:gliding motility lipoprotein GldD [Wenyingzhuangia heitensis]NIJ43973.1 gliding motility-associated lipoprotein GldD [Wenyingzhuangia heitensis]